MTIKKTTFETILAPHRDAVIERMTASPVVLLAQDTMEDDDENVFNLLKATAPQLSPVHCWYRILSEAMKKYLNGGILK